MILHFYTLEETKEGTPYLKIEACETKEEMGMILPVGRKWFPGGTPYVMHSNVGHLYNTNRNPTVALKEPDIELAKQLIAEYVRKELTHHQRMVKFWEDRLQAVERRKE